MRVNTLLTDCDKTESELRIELAEKEKQFQKMMERNESRISETTTFCNDTSVELKNWIS